MLPSLLFGKPSFGIFKNEPNTSLQKFSTLMGNKVLASKMDEWAIFSHKIEQKYQKFVENGPVQCILKIPFQFWKFSKAHIRLVFENAEARLANK